MRLGLRDAVAALLMAGIITPYAGLLVRGRMPYVEDVRMMAAVALVLGSAAILVADQLSVATYLGRVEIGFALVTLALGVIAMAFATTVFGQLLLGAFVAGILLTWGVQLLDHAGYSTGSAARGPDGR
jgi:hypothetical protein